MLVSLAWLASVGAAPAFGQDCNNNGIPDVNEQQGAHYSLNFDTIDDTVRIPRSTTLEQTNELTFEAWVFPYSSGPSHSGICRIANDFGAGYLFQWQWSGAGKIELRIDQATNGGVIIQDPTPISTYSLQWTHVAFTYSVSANSVRIFVNGVQKATAPAVGPLRYSNADLYFGNTPYGFNNDFDGRIDEVRMWNVARTQAQIAADMGKRLNAPHPGLVAYWRFDEGTGQSVQDSSTFGNHGFRGTNNTTESSDPLWLSIGAPITTADCNGNGNLDVCDIASATSQDCNGNASPDECEWGGNSDCNGNGTPDLCDIHAGTSLDCNSNGIPDSCDIAAGSLDIDFNGVPDSCSFPLVYERVKPCGRVYLGITGGIDGVRIRTRTGGAVTTLQLGQLDYIGGTVTFDNDRNLLVSEWNEDSVRVISRDGTLVRTLNGGGLDGPHGATVAPGGKIAVCSYLTDSVKFYSQSGTYLNEISHDNGTEDLHCLAYDRSGNLYVGCRNNGSGLIGKFNPQLQFVSYIGQSNFNPHPLDMAFDANQNLYVTTPGMIRKFNSSGTLVQTITQAGLDPRGISIDEIGRLWVTNLTTRTIFRFTSAGTYIDTININLGAGAPTALALYGIALDVKPDGDCNGNTTGDACDIDAGDVDCDNDGVIDSCQLASNDCNSNGVLDRCESGDCDNDGVRDNCEILSGAADCNANGVPDTCDVTLVQRSFLSGLPRAWPTEHTGSPPLRATDGNPLSYTWSTASNNTQNPSYLGLIFARPTPINGIRLWKDNDGGGGPTTKNLVIQYTTDSVVDLGSGVWQNVSGLVNGFQGAELLQATAVNNDGTVTGDVHDSVNEFHGWASLSFNRVMATGIRIAFSNANISTNHYKVHEFQPYRIDAPQDCDLNGVPDSCDVSGGPVVDCNSNGIPDSCDVANEDVTSLGTIVAKIFSLSPPNPMGGGSLNPETIRDGIMPGPGNDDSLLQYDTYHQGAQGNEDWIGYTFASPQVLKGLLFQEGIHFNDGGWFDSFTVQIRSNGAWISVTGLSVFPAYPGNNGVSFETFLLSFAPITADGIRLYGDGGGSAQHFSVGELRVLKSTDCNSNNLPDSCDLGAGDCDGNGVPDDCQPNIDCDGNGVRDLCEPGGRADCDGDGVTNYCQVAAGATDCDGDWVPDNCEAGAGNYSLTFDDVNDRVRVPRTASLEPGSFTIELWAKLNNIQSRNTRMVRKLASRGFIFAADQNNDQRIQLRVANPGTIAVADTQSHAAYVGQWHHFAATFTATQAKLYVDGVLKATTNHATGALVYTPDDLYFGAGLPASDTSEFFGGSIDEVRLWSYARTEAQIAGDRTRSFADPRPGLVGYWKLNSGGGQSAVDSSGLGNHGQLGIDALPAGDSGDPVWSILVSSLPGPNDCNGNQIPDACDIAAATVTDCNANNVPDSCESDCNNNGIADACDIAGGTVPDCNGNGIPDACDIAAGTSTDVNTNGVPDSCEPDIRLIPVISIINPTSTSEIRSVQPSSINAVSRGTRYYIEVWASDVGGTNTGLTGAYTDVNFCSQTTATAVFHGGIFNVFPAGTIQTSKVDEFGGSALPNGGGIAPQWVRVGWIEMNAGTESAGCNVSLTPGAGGVAAFNRGLINPALIVFGSVSLVITPPAKSYDLDNSTIINVGDLSLFAGSWLQSVPPGNTNHDFDCDDGVGVSDLSWFATGWNKSVTDPTILYPPCDGGGGGGWGPDDPGQQPTDIDFEIAVLTTPSSTDNRVTVPNSVTNINEGQQYYVEIWASDVGDINTGITSAYVDLMLPPTAAALISINHNGIFTVFPSGAEDEGQIDELGGSHLNADAGASPIWSRVATVRLFADANRPVKVFSLAPSATGVAAYGRGGVSWNAIDLDTISIGTPGLGDLDADGDVDQADMPLFINVLLGTNTNPGHIARSDMNADATANGGDISGFVAELTGP